MHTRIFNRIRIVVLQRKRLLSLLVAISALIAIAVTFSGRTASTAAQLPGGAILFRDTEEQEFVDEDILDSSLTYESFVELQYNRYVEMEQEAKNLETTDYDCPQSFIDRYPEQSVGISLRNFRGMKGEDKYVMSHFFANKNTPGKFIELGALDGHGLSNTLVFQRELGWTGVLIEPQITNYVKLEDNRRADDVHTLHAAACLKPQLIKIAGSGGQALASTKGKSTALCEPMSTLLSRTGLDHVDFYSIDVEGSELNVVLTHDWSKVPAFVVMVEMRDVPQDLEKNRVVRNALKLAGLCRFSSGVGHHNEVWVNTTYSDMAQ
jgi:FkbM family methyltransferase